MSVDQVFHPQEPRLLGHKDAFERVRDAKCALETKGGCGARKRGDLHYVQLLLLRFLISQQLLKLWQRYPSTLLLLRLLRC